MFQDRPGIMYENPPPPDDYVIDAGFFEKVSDFTFPRPQSVPDVNFIKIDRSLIHRKYLGYDYEERTSADAVRRNESIKSNEIIQGGLKAIKIEDPSSALEEVVDKNKDTEEDLMKQFAMEKARLQHAISLLDESTVSPEKNGGRKQKNESKEKKTDDIGSGDSKDIRKKKTGITSALLTKALESISKSYSLTKSDSDDEEHKSKSSSHKAKSHSKKSSRHKRKDSRHDRSYSDSNSESDSNYSGKSGNKSSSRKGKSHSKKSSQHKKKDKDSRNDHSNSDVISEKLGNEKVGQRMPELSVKQEVLSEGEILSDTDENFSSSIPKNAEITVKKEVISFNDEVVSNVKNEVLLYKKDKKKSSKKCREKYDDSRNFDDSNPDDFRDQDSRSHDGFRDRYDDSRNSYDGYPSPDGSRSRHYDDEEYKSRHYDDDSRNRHYDDSDGSSRDLKPFVKREIKQEIKQEPESASRCIASDYFCHVCKIELNSESTYNSHMAGKKHKKTQRQQSEQEVAMSSVLEIKGIKCNKFPRPPDMERIVLPNEISKVQGLCEDPKLFIVGLNYVLEIRGYEETKYYCELCDAQCVPISIIKHLIGYKHQINCLKKFYYRSYSWVKDLDKRDARAERELKSLLREEMRLNGRGIIKVCEDIERAPRIPEPFIPHLPSTSKHEPFSPHQPSTSSQGQVSPVKKTDELKITDEEYLSRDYSDFYCTVCDSHMNNFSMWESHARGKKHAKNKKKAPEGIPPSNDFIEAPKGSISRLENIIHDYMHDYPEEVIVGLNFIRENQGENGDLYNCYLCGSVCPTMDIIAHLCLKKHKTKYLEKMLSNGHHNAINEINILPIGEQARENLINDECFKMLDEVGPGKPVICIAKK